MQYALDIGIFCVFLLFAVIGARRGFIKSAAHFLGSVIAAFLASALGGAAAQWVFDVLFRQALVEKIGESVASLGVKDVSSLMNGVLSSLPDFIVRALEEAGVTASVLEGTLAAENGETAELIADSISPVFVGFLKVLAVIVLFSLFMMLIRALADLLAGVFRFPVLRQLDGLLGGVFGFLLALVSLWLLVSVVQVFLPMLAADTRAEVQEALDHSVIAGLMVKSNPFGAMLR